MKKICSLFVSLLVFGLSFNAYATTQWRNGTGENSILGTENVSDIDSVSYNNIIKPLDSVLADFRQNAQIVYASASTLTVNAGSLLCSNSDGSIRLMARNTSTTAVAWTNIDTGAEATATTYYVYAVMSAASDTTFTCKISTSSTAPAGSTYYRRLGSFYNDASGNITLINNDDDLTEFGDWVSKSVNTTYQALTDGYLFVGTPSTSTTAYNDIYIDTFTPPTTLRMRSRNDAGTSSSQSIPCSIVVKKGDYYLVTGNAITIWFIPKQ